MLSLRFTVVSILSIVLFAPAGASATVSGVRATLDGRRVAVTEAAKWHCHDLALPELRCFRSGDAVMEDVGRLSKEQAARANGVAYVRVWEHAAYAGASLTISKDYANLGSVGWNDRITSFKGQNGGSGRFFEHTDEDGARYDFCCDQQVSNIGSTWNDQISSVKAM